MREVRGRPLVHGHPWRAPVGTFVVVLVAVGLVASCAVSSGSAPAWESPHIRVPAVPFPAARSFIVAPDVLENMACEACARDDTLPLDSAHFFYGRLPLAATDALLAGPAAAAPGQLGNLYVSGYFGGLYLRDNLASTGVTPSAAPLRGLDVRRAILDVIGGATHGALDTLVAGLLRTARTGSEEEVRSSSRVMASLLALVYGYNRGYLEVAIANPPSGTHQAPAPLSCPSFFDCRVASLPLESLDRLAPTLGRLVDPPDPSWQQLSATLGSLGSASVPGGRAVWTGLLSGAGFDPAGYSAIIDLSYGFLEVTEAALLAVAEGAAGDVATGRQGLVGTAGLLLWAGSYFLGLASGAPTGDLPVLDCGTA